MSTSSVVFSDLFVNMAAGWFGAAFIFPMTSKSLRLNLRLLFYNIACGILCLIIAINIT